MKVDGSKFYLIGVATVFLASKFEDVKFINLQKCYETVGRSKFSPKDIVDTELEILKCLGFRVSCPHNLY